MIKKVSMEDLIRKNKEELLKDKTQIDRIEKRIDQKYLLQSKQSGGDK